MAQPVAELGAIQHWHIPAPLSGLSHVPRPLGPVSAAVPKIGGEAVEPENVLVSKALAAASCKRNTENVRNGGVDQLLNDPSQKSLNKVKGADKAHTSNETVNGESLQPIEYLPEMLSWRHTTAKDAACPVELPQTPCSLKPSLLASGPVA